MNVFEAENYAGEHMEDFLDTEMILEDTDEYAIYLEQPAYVVSDYNIVCYEGFWYDKEAKQADFSLTAVFRDGEYEYYESDGVAVTLHNYLRIAGINSDLNSLEVEVQNLDFIAIDMTYLCTLHNMYKLKTKELV